jgi:hypothetical protein
MILHVKTDTLHKKIIINFLDISIIKSTHITYIYFMKINRSIRKNSVELIYNTKRKNIFNGTILCKVSFETIIIEIISSIIIMNCYETVQTIKVSNKTNIAKKESINTTSNINN